MNKLAERLQKIREENKLSQRELGGLIGVSHGAVFNWETGIHIPNVEMLYKICRTLKVSADYLIGLKDSE